MKTTWRAKDGETAEEILAKVAKVARFIPRGGWTAYRSPDGTKGVAAGFVRRRTDKDDETFSIYWAINADGSISSGPMGFKAVDLGWQAFALLLIQDEVDDELKGANVKFLFDPRNLNFMRTDAGPLGDLFVKNRCTPGTALHAGGYLDKGGADRRQPGDFWTFDTTVTCKSTLPRYCSQEGPIVFRRTGRELWQPAASCANLLVGRPVPDFLQPLMQ